MTDLFVQLFNMSITAGWLILAVIVVRLLSKKMPKTWHCFLWYLVLIRLLLPMTIESDFSLIPNSKVITEELLYGADPVGEIERIHITGRSGLMSDEEKQAAHEEYLNRLNSESDTAGQTAGDVFFVDSITPNPGDSVNPLQVIVHVASYIWLAGLFSMLLYTVISYKRVAKRVREAVRLEKNVYQSEQINSPFVFGIIKPRIYVPFSLEGEALDCVLAHEGAHIKRKDHIIRPIAFFLLAVYWFHPLVWVAYILFCRDVELACDETVLRRIGMDKKKLYSKTLLECSVTNKVIAACPLAFGETGVRQRIKNILSYKKPTIWLTIVAVILCVITVVCFMTNPVNEGYGTGTTETQYTEAETVSEENSTIKEDSVYFPTFDNSVERIENGEELTEVLEEPPHLLLRDMLSSRYSDFNVSSGNYTWYVVGEEDEVGMVACGAHPMEAAKNVEQLVVPNYNSLDAVTYYAGASVNPDRLTVSSYAISDVGNVDAKPIAQHTIEDISMIELKQNRIYTIIAEWKEDKKAERGFYGEAEYVVVTGDVTAYEEPEEMANEEDSANETKTPKPEITVAFTEEVNTLDGVTMYMEKYKATEGDVEIRNESGKDLEYGEWYDIQVKMDDDRWYSLAMIIDNVAYHAVAYPVKNQETSVWPVNWSYCYGELPAGKYRMVKDIMDFRAPGDYTEYYLATEFEIK